MTSITWSLVACGAVLRCAVSRAFYPGTSPGLDAPVCCPTMGSAWWTWGASPRLARHTGHCVGSWIGRGCGRMCVTVRWRHSAGLTSTILPVARSVRTKPSVTASKIARYSSGTSAADVTRSGLRSCAITLTVPSKRALMQANATRLRHLSRPPESDDRHKDRPERRCASPTPAPIMKQPGEAAERFTE